LKDNNLVLRNLNQMSVKEIGSEFDLDITVINKKKRDWRKFFPKKKMVFLCAGRDGLVYAIRSYKIKKLLIPSYFEDLVLRELKKEVKVELYNIKKNLEIDLEDIKKKIENNQAILIVHYFGFPQPIKKINEICDIKKTILIEDCVQSMLSKNEGIPLGSIGDISFNSLRKFIGIPDGCIVTTQNKISLNESKIHKKYVQERLYALNGKNQYLNGNKNYTRFYFKEAFIKPEERINKYPKPAPMSKISKKILATTDFLKIYRKRRSNFKFFLGKLEKISLFQNLPSGVCPLGFPILIKNRNQVKKILVQNKIYPPIHWELSAKVKKEFTESGKISDHILTIPIDQRYSNQDLERVIHILKKCEKYE